MSIKCEDCISLAICINEIIFMDDEYSFLNYLIFNWSSCVQKCSYLHEFIYKSVDDPEYISIKKFFLKQKGLL